MVRTSLGIHLLENSGNIVLFIGKFQTSIGDQFGFVSSCRGVVSVCFVLEDLFCSIFREL